MARELREELSATLVRSRKIAEARHHYANFPEELQIHFFAAAIAEAEVEPHTFEQLQWVLPKELGTFDFLAADRQLIAELATGKIKPGEILEKE